MKRFRFALRPVAIVRAEKELRARQALAEALGRQRAAEDALAQAQRCAQGLEQLIAAGRRGSFRPDIEAMHLEGYRQAVAGEVEAARQLAAARAEVGRRRSASIEAHRQLKVVSRLEERARAAYRLEALRAEQAELDEQASLRSSKRVICAHS
jgi:flagellar FliJ protein